jgi:hypothetical protein
MTVIHGDYPARKTPQGRGGSVNDQESAPRRSGADKELPAPPMDENPAGAAAKIRARLIELQSSVSRSQRLLGGLYGLRDLLQSEPAASGGQLKAQISAVAAAGAPEALRQQLQVLAERGDLQSLNGWIRSTEQEITRLSASLGKTEIADQNARSLAARESLTEIARGLREKQVLPQRLSREQVLKLLS